MSLGSRVFEGSDEINREEYKNLNSLLDLAHYLYM